MIFNIYGAETYYSKIGHLLSFFFLSDKYKDLQCKHIAEYNDKMVCVDIETGKVADSSSGGGKGKGKKSGQDFF